MFDGTNDLCRDNAVVGKVENVAKEKLKIANLYDEGKAVNICAYLHKNSPRWYIHKKMEISENGEKYKRFSV